MQGSVEPGELALTASSPGLAAATLATLRLETAWWRLRANDHFQLMGVFDVAFVSGGLGLFGSLLER